MASRAALGTVARHLPFGRGHAARWLQTHANEDPIEFVDASGHCRTVDLRDDIECQWFAGVNIGLPEDLLAHVGPGDWAIDIGANIGVVAGQLATRVGETGQVWAIEPIPRNVERLGELRDRNGLTMIRTFGVACGADDGSLTLRLPPSGFSGWASATASWMTAGDVTVPLRSIDSLVAEHGADGRRLALIKIDVEGYEAQVLEGAQDTLEEFRPLLYVEFNDEILRDAGSSSLELLDRFKAAGYEVATTYAASAGSLSMRVVDLLLSPVA